MSKTALIYGAIIGALFAGNFVFIIRACYSNADFPHSLVWGFTIMFAILSLIFFGVKNYRDKQLGGYITFLEALKAGALIAFIASTFYVLAWLVCYYFFVPDFIDVYSAAELRHTAPADLAAKKKELDEMRGYYSTPVGVALVTYVEVLPAALLVAVLSAAIVMKKRRVVVG